MSHFRDQHYQSSRAQELVPDWEEKYYPIFERIIKTWSQPIRDYYKKVMGVGLINDDTNKRQAIKINIKPIAGLHLILDIHGVVGDLDFEEFQKLKAFLVAAENAHHYFQDAPEHYENLSKLIELTREKLSCFDLESLNKKFIDIFLYEEPDVFGRYRRVTSTKSEIELYVIPCVLFCEWNNLDLSTFVTMVLAHELAHGYNHLGVDKDNYHWDSFWETETFLKEGLAQYYTKGFLKKNKLKLPKGVDTFDFLLKHQSDAYKSFLGWNATPEKVYSAFIETRRNNIYKNVEYLRLLDGAKQRIKGNMRAVDPDFASLGF